MTSPDRHRPAAEPPLLLITLFEDEAAATRSELILANALTGLGSGYTFVRRSFAFRDLQRQPDEIAQKISAADIVAVAAAASNPLPSQLCTFLDRSLGQRSSPAALVAVCIETPAAATHPTDLELTLRDLAERHRLRMIVTHASLRASNAERSAPRHVN